uniref:PHD and RING finger domain-containing protein 1-like n=1 Tax=Sinocyclocheilus anshuiensis TaxID=1608454 RepID=A0A671RFD7_9TELE
MSVNLFIPKQINLFMNLSSQSIYPKANKPGKSIEQTYKSKTNNSITIEYITVMHNVLHVSHLIYNGCSISIFFYICSHTHKPNLCVLSKCVCFDGFSNSNLMLHVLSLSVPKNTTPRGSSSGETGDTPISEESLIQPSGGAGPSFSPLRRSPPAHSSPGSSSTPQNPTSPPIHSPHLPHSHPSPLGHPPLHPGTPHRPVTLNPPRPGNSHLSTNGIRSQPLSSMPNGPSNSPHQDKDGPFRQPPVKKPPPKPVWVDVSVLPRIPKIKRDSTSSANSNSGSSSSTLPGSSANSLAGNTGRERTVDQQGTGASQQNRTVDAQRQRADKTGASSSFSSSFTSTTSSFSASSNSRPSSSSVSFRINTSGNPWQARRLPASGGTLPGGHDESIKRNNKSKQMLLSLRAKAKEEKSEVYDPFNPTGSDSSDNEPENEGPDVGVQNTGPRVPIGACHPIKSEPLDVHSDTERGLEMCEEVKMEPESLWDRPCKESRHHSDTMHSPSPSGGPALDSTRCEAGMDTGSGGTPGSPFQKTEEHSSSSSSCSEKNVEVKSEPETGPPPIRPQSKSLEESLANLQQAYKGNGVCKELPSVSGAFNSSKTTKDKEERPQKSQSKDRKRPPSNSQSFSSKDSHKKKHSKDRRCSSSSSSRERKTSGRRASHERNDSRGRERHRKRSKERRHSRSHSFSRSRSKERRRTSKDQGETRLKMQKSRSTSRERKWREDRSEISRRTERSSHKSTEPMSTELHEPDLSANKITTPVKTERDARPHECETTVALPSVKVEITPNEIKQEEPWPTGSVKELKDIKKEDEVASLDIFSTESPNVNEIKAGSADLEKSHASLQDEMKGQEMVVEPKTIKIEKIWLDEDDSPSCSDNPLVINLDMADIDAVNCKKEPTESYHSPLLEEDMEMSPLQPPDLPIKQEPVVSSDEDISVDYLIDNLDFIKKEMSESSVADSTEAADPKSAMPEAPAENKQTTETVTPGAKSKSQGKRVTWNLQEPAEPQSEKLSKLALFKLKLKQEGSRRSATTPQNQYMMKLHMQERAIEEVKLAIKPFYQKRDITKEEYKEILRKAVQKVCHSKSGEINPVKVANLVKAYVDKYKHARKHKKEETGQIQQADVPKDSQTPM